MMWGYLQSCCGTVGAAVQYRYYTDSPVRVEGQSEVLRIAEKTEKLRINSVAERLTIKSVPIKINIDGTVEVIKIEC